MVVHIEAVTSLCLDYGLCCDGSLFGVVELLDGENYPVDLTKTLKSEIRVFNQPCQCFNGKCSIYESRPERCAAYHCDTAKMVKSGRLTLSRGQARVKKMRAHIVMFRNLSGDQRAPMPTLAKQVIKDFKAQRTHPAYASANRTIVEAAYRYRKLKSRYFRSRWKRYARRFLRLAASFNPIRMYHAE